MKNNNFIFFIIISLLLSGCYNHHSQQNIKSYKIDLKNNIIYPFTNFMKVDNVIYLETNKESLLKSIDRIRFSEKRIFIFTNRDIIRVFSFDGKYLYNIGKTGKGPAEILMATDFDISPSNEKVAIWDRNRSEIKLYYTNGRFIKGIKSKNVKWGFRLCWFERDHFLLSSINRPQNGKRYQAYIVDDNLTIKKRIIPYDPKLENWAITGKVFTKDQQGGTRFRHPFGYDIYQISNDNIEKSFRLDFGEYKLTKNDMEKFVQNSRLLFTTPKAIVVDYQELNNYIYARYQFENRSYSLLINKNTNKQLRFNHSNPFDYSSFIYIIGVYDNKFVGAINPYKLREKLKKIGRTNIDKKNNDILFWKEILKNTKDSDNPIIVFLTPKI